MLKNVKNDADNPSLEKWEDLTYHVKQFSVQFAKKYQWNIWNRLKVIENEICDIDDSASDKNWHEKKRKITRKRNLWI